MSAVFKCNSRLLLIKRNIRLLIIRITVLIFIHKSLNYIIMKNSAFYYFFAVFPFNFHIKPAHRLYSYKRSHLAESVASALLKSYTSVVRFFFKTHLAFQSRCLYKFLHPRINIKGTSGNTSGSRTYKYLLALRIKCQSKFFPGLLHHFS